MWSLVVYRGGQLLWATYLTLMFLAYNKTATYESDATNNTYLQTARSYIGIDLGGFLAVFGSVIATYAVGYDVWIQGMEDSDAEESDSANLFSI